MAEHKENVGRAEWTPRLGESGLGILKYVVCSHLQMVRLSSVLGQVGKLQFPSNETSSEKPLHGTHVPTFAESSRFSCRHQGGHVHTDR